MRTRLLFACLLIVALLTGCSNTSYYLQSIRGHLALINAAQPIDTWLADPNTPPALKARLQLAQRMRRFAVSDLGLPDNASYQRYADLHRSAVVWNVVAAPPDSLTLKTWCFPVVGQLVEHHTCQLPLGVVDKGVQQWVATGPVHPTQGRVGGHAVNADL